MLKNKLYNENGRLSEIDYDIDNLYIQIVKLSFTSSNSSKKDLEDKINKLKNEKEKILKDLGYKLSDLDKKHMCDKCNDTGYVGNKMCTCLKKFFVDYTYENSHLKEKFKEENFDTFNLDFYSNEKSSKDRLSPKENMQLILKVVHDFCDNFSGDKNLFFYGQAGLGKTFLCNCIAKELLDEGYSVVYYSACNLFKLISDETFNKDYNHESKELKNIYNAELLIIDDLGTEFITTLSTSEFFNILNTRIDKKKATIISSNLEIASLRDTYSERVSSRIIQSYEVLKFIGDNIRFKVKK